jgi:hypothetical protein
LLSLLWSLFGGGLDADEFPGEFEPLALEAAFETDETLPGGDADAVWHVFYQAIER